MAAEQDEVDAARAFDDLRAEVSVARRAVEDLPQALMARLPPQPPDYGKDLGKILSALAEVNARLAAIEAQPALTSSPSAYAEAMRQAGEKAMGSALQDARTLGKTLADTIGHKRGREEQRDRVMLWAGSAGLFFLLLGLAGSPFVATHLPFGWSGTVASIVMGQPDRWDAGTALMKAANPALASLLGDDWDLVSGDKANARRIAACKAEAAKSHKPQECRIVVKAEK